MQVIIADDSMVVRTIVERVVNSLGYRSLKAANGREVIEILEKMGEEVALILLDWNMPILDGFKTLVKIKEDRRFASIPVIMLTSESEDQKIQKAFEAGVAGYVNKPFTNEELIESVQQVMKEF